MTWRYLAPPIRIGIVFATLGLLLTVVGIIRGNIPAHPANIALALLIGGGVWFLVSWAVAAAIYDAERDADERVGEVQSE